MALGFAVFALRLPLEGTPYHHGFMETFAASQDNAAAAAMAWIIATAAGGILGAVAGALLFPGAAVRHGRLLTTAGVAASGIYLVALRGWWGYASLPPNPDGTYPAGIVIEPLPAVSLIVPGVAALAAAIALGWWQSRRNAETATIDGTEAARFVLSQLALSFAAALLLVQLPLWGSAVDEFLHGLPDFAALVGGSF